MTTLDNVYPIISKYPIISDQISRDSLEVVLRQLDIVQRHQIPGDVVEFGCYIGTTSLFIRRMLDRYSRVNEFHVYDSFEGLPPKSDQDRSTAGDNFVAGELKAGKKQLYREFLKAHLKPPIVHKGWFSELDAYDVPERISFAFLDGDFYESIMDSLKLIWPRLSPGGAMCIDDFGRSALPGVERAVRDYFQGKPPELRVDHGIGIVYKS